MVRSLGREVPLEKEMATHSSTLAWRNPWMEEPGGLQSMGPQRVGHDWATSLSLSSQNVDMPIFTCLLRDVAPTSSSYSSTLKQASGICIFRKPPLDLKSSSRQCFLLSACTPMTTSPPKMLLLSHLHSLVNPHLSLFCSSNGTKALRPPATSILQPLLLNPIETDFLFLPNLGSIWWGWLLLLLLLLSRFSRVRLCVTP